MPGPLMLDLAGPWPTAEERQRLTRPEVGGVILFRRNLLDFDQVTALVSELRALRSPRLLVGIDHEGGRVQRLGPPWTALPAMRRLGMGFDHDAVAAEREARELGWLAAAELLSVGIDLSFAPVLDLDWGHSEIIGSRAFHSDPEAVARLARAFMSGMAEAGMKAVGKHFPGHGFVRADSHLELPHDLRSRADLEFADLLPFARLIDYGIPALMSAHVVFPVLDPRPVTFSPYWLKQVLRTELQFEGAVVTDDLSMAGAHAVGGMAERVRLALDAGCDLLLVCNDPQAQTEALEAARGWLDPAAQLRRAWLAGAPQGVVAQGWQAVRASARWQAAHQLAQHLALPPG